MIGGIVLSAVLWGRIRATRPIPVLVFVGALVGSVLGAKVGYLLCESPFRYGRPDYWVNLLVGRTVIGGILGGYLGVEWGKWQSGYRPPTGDVFALVVPLGIAVGRIGCYLNGCCPGLPCEPTWYALRDAAGTLRYPSSLVEAAFQVAFVGAAFVVFRRGMLRGQLFHLYMITYGLFRMAHELYRDTPRIGPVGTYQLLAAVLVAFGIERFVRRARSTQPCSVDAGATVH